MSIQHDNLVKALRDLPYADMMRVAESVSVSVLGTTTLERTAAVASALAALQPSDPAQEDLDEQNLKKIFRRKRSVTITPMENGWSVAVPGVPGSQAQSPSLRVAMQHMLDQSITAHIMLGGK